MSVFSRYLITGVVLALGTLFNFPALAFDINANNRMIRQDYEDRRIRAEADARQRSFENKLNRRTRAEKAADQRAARQLACAIFGCGPVKKPRRKAQTREQDVQMVSPRRTNRQVIDRRTPERVLPLADHGWGALPPPPSHARARDRFVPLY